MSTLFNNPVLLITFAPVLLFSLTFHEAAHAWTSNRIGDPTARMLGRLSLNPLVHLDIFGTLMLVVSGFRFGWAKPVPVDPRNFHDPKRGMFLTAFAGPVSNMILALACGIVIRVMLGVWGSGAALGMHGILLKIFGLGVVMNLSLAFFNLIPLPPLDGSKILYGLAPRGWDLALYKLERVGPAILIALIAMGFFVGFSPIWMIMSPFVRFFTLALTGIPLHVLYGLVYS